jgi:hypothetical protein
MKTEPVTLEQVRRGGQVFIMRTLNPEARRIAAQFPGTRRSKSGVQLIKRRYAAAIRQACETAGIPASLELRNL